jgi:hypothetical protein
MIKPGGPDKPVRWEGHCYSRWDELMRCLIEATTHDAVRISCVLHSTGGQECFLELREDHIEEFQGAPEFRNTTGPFDSWRSSRTCGRKTKYLL